MYIPMFRADDAVFRPLHVLAGLLILPGLVLGLGACDGSSVAGSDPGESAAPVSMAFSDGAGATSKNTEGQRTLTDPEGNTLRLDAVEMVVREIEFDRADDDEDCSGEEGSGSDDDCEKIESGPILVPLPLNAEAPTVVVDTTLPIGRWEEVEFEVHKLEPQLPADSAFLAQHDFPPEASIRVQGRYTPAGGTGQDFTFTSDLNAEREIELEPPIEVSPDSTTNITFSVEVNEWFRRADRSLVDPAQAGEEGPFDDLVEENIEASIEGFEDDDRDGEEDGDDEDEDDEDDEDDETEVEIETDLENTGPDPDTSGDAEFEQESDRTEFKLEVEDLSAGTYQVSVADTTRGELDVGEEGGEAEIEFRQPSEEGHPPLEFDPRGQHVAVRENGTTYLEVDFPINGEEDD